MSNSIRYLSAIGLFAFSIARLLADGPAAPVITNLHVNGSVKAFDFAPYPGAQFYNIQVATNLLSPFTTDTNFYRAAYNVTNVFTNAINGSNVLSTNIETRYEWRRNTTSPSSYYRVVVTPMNSNTVRGMSVLNRLTYGLTPDDIERINSESADSYLYEQLSPWLLTEDVLNTHPNLNAIEAKFAEQNEFVDRTNATIADLRAWHVLRAVGASRQFLEVLLQFLENHFVTQWSKCANSYFDTYYDDGTYQNTLAAQFEYLENKKWRNALLNPTCTFYDLLKISAESPAMIIYLDTYSSRGNGSNIANENYAREIMELFCMGVDNGYDQNDITVQSRIWTGWTIDKVSLTNAFNPFATVTTNIIPWSTNTSTTTKSNLYGAWSFVYRPNFHNTSVKTIFPNKYVPSRYGLPWTTNRYAGNSSPGLYQIVIPGHATSDTNGISEAYQFMTNVANYPFTEEYISIKLCRLLIHDDFPNPSNDPSNENYAFYNYAAGNLSPEASLVRACMLTWETNRPKGQIWKVLKTITDSELFRGQNAAQQKIKTPLELAVSTVRALRSSTNGSNLAGSFTAFTDGYNISGTAAGTATVLTRSGNMLLFDRDSPDGYPETGPPWVSAGTLSERLRFIQSFCAAIGQPGHTSTTNDAGSNTGCDIVGLLKAKTPNSTWNKADQVADFFLGLLYPAEGNANLQLYRTAAINFLNTDDNGATSSFANLSVSGTAGSTYDNRLRGMVAMLMTFPRFQEQ